MIENGISEIKKRRGLVSPVGMEPSINRRFVRLPGHEKSMVCSMNRLELPTCGETNRSRSR